MSATSRFDQESAAYQDRLSSIRDQANSAKELALLSPGDAFKKVIETTSEPLGAHLMATGLGNFLGKDAVGQIAKGNIKAGLQKAVQNKIGDVGDVKSRIAKIADPIRESAGETLSTRTSPFVRDASRATRLVPDAEFSNPFSTPSVANMDLMPASESLLTRLEARGQLAAGAGRSDPSLPDLPGLSETTPESVGMDQLAPLREMMANRNAPTNPADEPTVPEPAGPKPGTTSRIDTGEIQNPLFEGVGEEEGGVSGASIATEDAAKTAASAAKSAAAGAADDALSSAGKIAGKVGAGLEGLGDDAALALAPETGGLSELAGPLIGGIVSLFGGLFGEHHNAPAAVPAPKLSQPLFIPGLQQN